MQIHQADEAAETSADESEVEEADDMEDIGGPSAKKGKAEGTELSAAGLQPAKQMLTPVLRAALSKQGYSLIGVLQQAISDWHPSCFMYEMQHHAHDPPVTWQSACNFPHHHTSAVVQQRAAKQA